MPGVIFSEQIEVIDNRFISVKQIISCWLLYHYNFCSHCPIAHSTFSNISRCPNEPQTAQKEHFTTELIRQIGHRKEMESWRFER